MHSTAVSNLKKYMLKRTGDYEEREGLDVNVDCDMNWESDLIENEKYYICIKC